jgi:G:T-mismatch repair DNA endonuclease (very short patch repair protein)
MKKMWSEEEIEYLKELYLEKGLSLTELYSIFNEKFNRNENGISIKIVKLKLKHSKQQIYNIKSRLNSGENNGMFKKESWCKGLTKENNIILNENSKKLSIIIKNQYENGKRNTSGENNGMFGKQSWNKGLTKNTNEKIKKMSENTSQTRKIMYKNYSTEKLLLLKEQLIKARQQCKKKSTKIELEIENLLSSIGVSFIKQKPIHCFIVDFFVNEKLVIECLGDYWHCNPFNSKFNDPLKHNNTQLKNLERDKRKIEYFKNNNIKYLLLWEYDILNNINIIKRKILENI